MVFNQKTFFVTLFFLIVLGSVFGILNSEFRSDLLYQEPNTDAAVTSSEEQGEIPTFDIKKTSQDDFEDITRKYPMDAPMPDNVKTTVEYDIHSGNYVMRTRVGENEIATPFTLNEKEYADYSAKNELNDYWKELNAKAEKNNEDKFSITDIKFDIGKADKIFGPGGVQIKTQGSAELIFGVKTNKLENPALTERMRKTTMFDFDEKIQMNVTGNVGDKVNFNMNYNTESTFDFDQKLVKLNYKGNEDDIIRSIQAGNVSMQLNSSLISGSTALFGLRTDLQFGKLSVSAIASQQESETQTVSSKGGAQTTKFEVSIDNYDENRHFFIGHHFRNNYETAMSRLPFISSGITINRIEVWITNKRANYDEARNIVAFMDLGESERIDNPHWLPNSSATNPFNDANTLYQQIKNLDGVRDIKRTNAVLSDNFSAFGINGGEDYEKIESARRLQNSEYTFNATLGILSLRNTLNPDEVLGIAYEYTQGGNVYQVGEFSTDQVQAPEALIVKLIKGTAQSPQLAIWDLMMKNVYYLGAMQIQKEKFELNVLYRNDSIGTNLRYLTEGNTKNQLLLRTMNLDRLDSKQDSNPDGMFDYIEGFTAFSSTGRIMFPVLEPFGSHLKKMIGNDQLAEKYIFQELYDSTQVVAQELSEKNKFIIEGEYKASSGSEIRLNAMNVPRGSVTVTAGGATLTENVDYIVDYTMGSVNIINQSIIESGTQVDVKLENQSMFSLQRKTMLGTHMEYQFSKDFSLGGTIMHLSEMPMTTKVNTGNEPISNTIWGLNTSWRGQSQWLTNMLDKLPFVDATAPSTLAVNAEFAQLLPGHHKVVGADGYAYLDDFESTKTTFDIHYPVNWYLASTPSKFPESTSTQTAYGKNRALLSWYYVDPVLNQNVPSTPPNLRNNLESQSNHYTRTVLIPELFPNRETPSTLTTRMTVMNLSYYPTERGPYNLDVEGMDATGKLSSPEDRWGGIMRRLDVTDFETSNIEYIEFWMMDPFINSDGTDKGGDLFFNLGDISEDILKDGKKFFEHGLPIDDDATKVETTVWGVVPRSQSTVTAFDNTAGARAKQDVGLNGLSTENEYLFPTYKNYVDSLKSKLTSAALQTMEADPFSPLNDPGGDNYLFYRDPEYDKQSADILTRYKRYNGTEGNSPDAINSTQNYLTTATSLPDIEDINNDNTLNEYERYFQYHVQLRPEQMVVGKNYITDKITSNVKLENNNIEPVTWYQFKIPLREYDDKVGNIRNFKSIRFIRMFLTQFEQEKHLRFATLDLVRGEWRNYTKELHKPTETPISVGKLDVQAVNIEENSEKRPVNYILPPGVTRQTDPGQPQVLQQNEQSMLLMLTDLAPGDARAVYKSTSYDMRQYKRLQMFVHAEQLTDDQYNLKDDELTCFIRIGSDMVNNYYEYEVPLRLTTHGVYSSSSAANREVVWHPDNMIDFSFEALTEAKLKRNKAKGTSQNVSNLIPYYVFDDKKPRNRITVVGNPTIAEVENIMIGVRNRSNNIKSGEIWVNELRMSEFNEESGWAAMANVALGLSDIGNINFAGRVETAGYGSLESNVMERRNDDLYQMNFSTSLELGRFLPKAAKVQLPAYFSYSNETLSPKYDPLDQDVELERSLENLDTEAERDSLLMISQTVQTSKNFTISSAKINIKSKKPQFYDPANLSFSYSFSETNQHSAEVEQNMIKQERGSVNYSYSCTNTPFEPFKEVKAFDKPAFKILKELNINYLPNSISFNTNMNRQYSQIKLRDFNTGESSGADALDVTFSKDFMWNRQFDFKWDLTKTLRFSLQTATNANIEEPYYTPEFGKEYYEQWRDTVWSNIRKLGTPYTYQQVFNASWNIPVNKIPLLDWITSLNTSYNGNYNWNRSARLRDMPDFGNIATSMRSWQVDGQLNFETLYNKSAYLKEVNARFTGTQRKMPNPKFQPKTYNGIINLEKGKKTSVKHLLGSQDFNLVATDKSGKKVNLKYKVVDASSIDISGQFNADSLSLTLVTVDPNVRSTTKEITDITTRILMSLRRASLTFRETNSLVLPGFLPNAAVFGQQSYGDGVYAPGIDFAFGLHNDKTIDNAIANEWLYMSDSIINPATTAITSDFDLKANLEPIPGLKIDLNAKRYLASNTTIQYMFDGMPTTFNGSYNITQVALLTAFRPIATAENNYASVTFDNFMSNRQFFANKLNAKYNGTRYPSTGFFSENSLAGTYYDNDPDKGKFTNNSSEVLIPAFLSAYTGRDPAKTATTPFLSLLNILPNWRMSYDGLSRIPWVKDKFRSISITHAYTCRYSIGSYTSYSTWVAMGDDDDSALGYIRNVQSNAPIPSSPFEISSVSLTEQFSPLIGINAALKNSMTTKFEYKKQRNLALNLSSTQLIDAMTDEFVIGFGYVVKDFDVILKLKNNSQSRIKNDLKINADLSYKDIKSLLRKIDQELTQASSGNKLLTLKIMADYVFSSKVNIQVFYDRQASTPLISSTFPVSSTNFGVSFKFMLTR